MTFFGPPVGLTDDETRDLCADDSEKDDFGDRELYPITNPPPPFYAACSSGGSCPAIPADAGYDAGAATELHSVPVGYVGASVRWDRRDREVTG